MVHTDLVSFPTLVEAPFIIVKIGKYTFGHVDVQGNNEFLNVTFPNFMNSLTVTKLNGEVNTYELQMEYKIAAGDDPNMLDHVFSEISDNRKITLSYGDWAFPTHIYKEEEALITNIKSNINFQSSSIIYNISAVSTSLLLTATKSTFPEKTEKGSTMLLDLIRDQRTEITKIFPGMANEKNVFFNNLIPTDDAVITVHQLTQSTVLDRMNQIVGSMKSNSDPSAVYGLVIIDDNKNDLNGPYFKVVKTSANNSYTTEENSYSIDIGYPGDNFVTNFSLQNDQAWTILYDTSEDSGIEQYYKRIDNFGKIVSKKSNSLTRDEELRTTDYDESWWRQVTEFPMTASLEIKGLIRPSMLMQYVRINSYFYGRKHISSGLYTITKQVDQISGAGYKTTLSLLKVKGDLSIPNTSNTYTYNMRGGAL